MNDATPSYGDLKREDSWIDYLRTRLPYSFERIESKGNRSAKYFVLSEPILLTGGLSATHHNFWRRWNVYYMSGKLLDYFSMSDVGREYRRLEIMRLLTDTTGTAGYVWPTNKPAFYNSM